MIRLAVLWKSIKRHPIAWWFALPASVVFFALAVYRLWLDSPAVAVFSMGAYAAVCGLLAWLNFLDENGLL